MGAPLVWGWLFNFFCVSNDFHGFQCFWAPDLGSPLGGFPRFFNDVHGFPVVRASGLGPPWLGAGFSCFGGSAAGSLMS